MDYEEFVIFARYPDANEAMIVKGKLESAGIEVRVQGEHMSRVYGVSGDAFPVELQIRKIDVVRARELLKE